MKEFKSKKEIQEAIKQQITSNDIQAIKAMLRIYEYQTKDEQYNENTESNNGVGFVLFDAKLLTSFSKQYLITGSLSEKQISCLKSKVGKYAGQLLNQAIQKDMYIKNNGKWLVNIK